MAIVKAAKTLVGKAINIAKKKKKELEKTKTVKKVKKQIKKVLKNPKVKKADEILDKAVEKTKAGAKMAGTAGLVGVGAGLGATTAVGTVAGSLAGPTIGKAVRASKKVIDKARGKKVKIDPKDKKKSTIFGENTSENQISDMLTGAVVGGGIGLGAGLTGLGMMAASIVKSNSSPEQEYTQERRSDGRFATTYRDKNANVVASAKQLSSKEIDDVRTRLAILDSILESNDPRERSKEFKEQIAYLATKYQISNISGKQLSIIIPNVKGGVQTFKKRTGISKLLLGDPSTNKNIQAAQRYYDKNIKG